MRTGIRSHMNKNIKYKRKQLDNLKMDRFENLKISYMPQTTSGFKLIRSKSTLAARSLRLDAISHEHKIIFTSAK